MLFFFFFDVDFYSFALVARLGKLGQVLLDGTWVGTNNLCHDFAVFEKEQSWHRGDFLGGSNSWQLVNVNLDKSGSGVFNREFFKHWSNHLTWTTPSGKEVHHNQILLLDGVVEFLFGLDNLNHCMRI